MTSLHPPAEGLPPDFGVGVLLMQAAPSQWHMGLLVPTSAGPHVADLQGHYHLEYRPYDPAEGFWWGSLALPPRRREDFAAYVVEHVNRWRRSIPYSPVFSVDLVFGDRDLEAFSPGQGLSCATFVLALVRDRLELSLLAVEGWPARTEDDDWVREAVVEPFLEAAAEHQAGGRLDRADALARHATALAATASVRRFRPGEVCAGGIAPTPGQPPLAFEVASVQGRRLEEAVRVYP